ncbi:restin homolog isoform X2 [Diachasma alloeum]|uniref:restin homolog isoform X2 n=1 Tax=Diachasma alloeum TaxID=454923 RepID=UPI0007381B4A|nr:restin homolog isoform X2 [Diachasma alloeum]
MSISQENGATILCQEVFDDASHPSNDEVLDYARRLGINPATEPYLLDLAREGLMAALPEGWQPCYLEPQDAWYYYHAATETTTWEHPLDAKYKELVEESRARHNMRHSTDDDSKTTAKDLETHEDVTLPKDPPFSKVPVLQTKIPTKLTPLKKIGLESSRRKASKKNTDDKSLNTSTLIAERTSRDYTNLRFQDPQFYESPNLPKNSENKINLREIVKRSESMSPRYEKDWEQLSNKFSSEENVIDIDRLSVSSLTKSDSKSLPERTENERNQNQSGNQKELLLSGGGSMFLKSSRSRDSTPNQDGGKIQDFHTTDVASAANDISDITERPKSILREKPYEDDDRPTEEERKSVRFDLEKGLEDMKFMYSGSEDNDWDSDSMGKQSSFTALKKNFSLQNLQLESSGVPHINANKLQKNSLIEENTASNSNARAKIVGRRFLVQNVSEVEHMNQLLAEDIHDDHLTINKFTKVKNIDLIPKTDSCSAERTCRQESNLNNRTISMKSGETLLSTVEASLEPNKQDNQYEEDEIPNVTRRDGLSNGTSQILQEKGGKINDVINQMWAEQEAEINKMRKVFEEQLENRRRELEIHFNDEQKSMERELENRLAQIKRQLAEKEKDEIQRLISEMDDIRTENLKKMRSELEMCYEKERQDILENIKAELDERKKELLELRNRELQVLENEFEHTLDDDRSMKIAEHELSQQYNRKIEVMKKELEKEFSDLKNTLRSQQREKVAKITEDHEKCLADILRDFRVDERLSRKAYKQRLDEIRSDLSRGIDRETKKISDHATRQQMIDFEKIRCEKRLLEDKYKILKEKYLKLKNEVRVAVERRSKRRESITTASETERSASTKTRTERDESIDQKTPSRNLSSNSRSLDGKNRNVDDESEEQRALPGFRRVGDLINTAKCESDDPTTASETMNSDVLKKRKTFLKKVPGASRNSHAPVNSSSELEFFRHRIHVERDSIKRAREALRVQRSIFQGRQRTWKQRSAKATLEQLVQEERELSEMEVGLHRTRSLLGEKIIHLRHSEQSLERVVNAKRNENQNAPLKNDELTLSDMSSASSGFSSTDLGTDTFIDKPDQYQESTEIIASLENLNSEIREIWGVLNKRQGNNIPPPPTLSYSDLGCFSHQHIISSANNAQSFGTPNIHSNILSQLTAALPSTTTQNIITQYGPNSGFTTSVGTVERGPSNLMERTRNMRDWLRQARMESTDPISPGEATL